MKSPYSPVDARRCRQCGKIRKKYRPKDPRDVNPYDAGQPRQYCNCN